MEQHQLDLESARTIRGDYGDLEAQKENMAKKGFSEADISDIQKRVEEMKPEFDKNPQQFNSLFDEIDKQDLDKAFQSLDIDMEKELGLNNGNTQAPSQSLSWLKHPEKAEAKVEAEPEQNDAEQKPAKQEPTRSAVDKQEKPVENAQQAVKKREPENGIVEQINKDPSISDAERNSIYKQVSNENPIKQLKLEDVIDKQKEAFGEQMQRARNVLKEKVYDGTISQEEYSKLSSYLDIINDSFDRSIEAQKTAIDAVKSTYSSFTKEVNNLTKSVKGDGIIPEMVDRANSELQRVHSEIKTDAQQTLTQMRSDANYVRGGMMSILGNFFGEREEKKAIKNDTKSILKNGYLKAHTASRLEIAQMKSQSEKLTKHAQKMIKKANRIYEYACSVNGPAKSRQKLALRYNEMANKIAGEAQDLLAEAEKLTGQAKYRIGELDMSAKNQMREIAAIQARREQMGYRRDKSLDRQAEKIFETNRKSQKLAQNIIER